MIVAYWREARILIVVPPRFLIVDDGWQQIENKDKDSGVVVQEGA